MHLRLGYSCVTSEDRPRSVSDLGRVESGGRVGGQDGPDGASEKK